MSTAQAHPNIALIKYWGNRDDDLRLPSNGSISLTLDTLTVETSVTFLPELRADDITLNGEPASPESASRITRHLDLVRALADSTTHASIVSRSNFPMGAGIASSAAAYAALTVAAAAAAGLRLTPQDLSRLARRGSGSASRSIFGGYVEWPAGGDDATSYARPLAPAEPWRLIDLVAIVSEEHKTTGSTSGHTLAATSPLQAARVQDTPRRLDACRAAILDRDFPSLARIVEIDSNLLHAVMLTSEPPLQYWHPATLSIMDAVRRWRAQGLGVCYTIDAGPNVHCLCLPGDAPALLMRLSAIPGVQRVLTAGPGPGAALLDEPAPLI
jgi:diphosphomevalonate decarboxylase